MNDKEKFIENLLSIVPMMFKHFMKGIPHYAISKQQFELLFQINCHNGKPMSFYSEKMLISKPNLTVLSNKLIQEELVKRVLDPADRRIISLKITEKGITFLEEHKRKIRQLLIHHFDALSETDLKRLNELLEEMKGIILKIKQPTDQKEELS